MVYSSYPAYNPMPQAMMPSSYASAYAGYAPSTPQAYYAPPPPQPYYPPPNMMAAAPVMGPSMPPMPMREPKEVRARHILVDTLPEAERLRRQILSGRDFAETARASSSCPSKRKGGDLGFFGHGEMVPEFDKVAFKMPVGAVSAPVKTSFGWHLIQVTEQRM
jgi:peptidyl-prolyl cis-trans isomerase C